MMMERTRLRAPVCRACPADRGADEDVELQRGDLKREVQQRVQVRSGEGEASRERKGAALMLDVADIEDESAENQHRPERRTHPAPFHRGLPVIVMRIAPDSAQAIAEGRGVMRKDDLEG